MSDLFTPRSNLPLHQRNMDVPYSRLSRTPMRATRMGMVRYLSQKWLQNLLKIILSIDNIFLLLCNASVAEPDAGNRTPLVEYVSALFSVVYFTEVFFSFFSLGKYWWKSPYHILDTLVVIGKIGLLLYIILYSRNVDIARKNSELHVTIPILMVITSLRLLFIAGRGRYMDKILKLFGADNIDLELVRQRIRSLPNLTQMQIATIERYLEQSVPARDRQMGAQEKLTFLHLVGKNLPRVVSALVAEVLSTRTLVVKVLEARNISPNPADVSLHRPSLLKEYSGVSRIWSKPYCVVTLRNSSQKKVSVLKDRVILARTRRRTAVSQKEGDPAWHETILFEGVSNDVTDIRIDVNDDGLVRDSRLYTVTIPLSVLNEPSLDDISDDGDSPKVDRWFKLNSKDAKFRNSNSNARIRIKLYYRHKSNTLSQTSNINGTKSSLNGVEAKEEPYGLAAVIRSTFWHWLYLWKTLFFGFIVLSVNAATPPMNTFYLTRLVDVGIVNHDWEEVKYCCFALVGLYGLSMLAQTYIGYVQSRVNALATAKLRLGILSSVLSQNTDFHQENSQGSLGAIFSTDIARINALWSAFFWNLLSPMFSILFAFGYLVLKDWNAALMGFGFIALVFSGGPKDIAAESSRDFSSFNAVVNSDYINAIGCQKIIRSYHLKQKITERFGNALNTLQWHEFASMFWSSNMQQFVETILNFFILIQTVALALLTYTGQLSTGDFFGLNTLYVSIVRPASALGGFSRWALNNAGSLQRVDNLLNLEKKEKLKKSVGLPLSRANSVYEPYDRKGRTSSKSETTDYNTIVTVKNLKFRYKPHLPATIDNFSMTIHRGSYVCLVGESGSGKSTILSILMGFRMQTSGSLVVDGKCIDDDQSIQWLQEQISVVFQEILLLNGTIMENIRYGRLGASDQDCKEAAKQAECTFIDTLPHEFDTMVGDNTDSNLSGGQMQRICLARALVRKPKILLLDEATSALDPETESAIVGTLERLASNQYGMTIISVTHRLSTTTNADEIFVLKDGCIEESGKYSSLMERDGLFSKLVNTTESGGDTKNNGNDESDSEEPKFSANKIFVASKTNTFSIQEKKEPKTSNSTSPQHISPSDSQILR